MAKKTKSLAQWCSENAKDYLIDELNMEKIIIIMQEDIFLTE